MKKLLPILIIFLVISTFVIYKFYPKIILTNKSKEMRDVTLILKWKHQAQFAGIYTAIEKGFYEKEGLNVKLLEYEIGVDNSERVLNGEAEFGIAGIEALLADVSEGAKIKAIAATYQDSPYVAFGLKRPDITKLSDMKGKKIGFKSLAPSDSYIVRAMMEYNGLDYESDLETVIIGYDPQEMIDGKADLSSGYLTNEPVALELMGYETQVFLAKENGINMYGDIIFTTDELIENDPKIVEAFLNATIKGWEYALNNEDEAVKYTLSYMNIDDKDMEYQQELQTTFFDKQKELIKPSKGTKIGDMKYVKWQSAYILMKDSGVIKNDLDVSEAYTTEFLY